MIDLLVLSSSDQLLLIEDIFFLFYKITYINEEVNCTEPFPLERAPYVGIFWMAALTKPRESSLKDKDQYD
jgi:hypothetical protein